MASMIPSQSTDDQDNVITPTPLRGKKPPMRMKTPGMGVMLGSPRPRAIPPVGKITPGTSPYEEPAQMASGGSVSSASKRADGCAVRGKTKGKML